MPIHSYKSGLETLIQGALIQGGKLNKSDWLRLVHARCALISPHLNSITLTEIGSIKFLGGKKGLHCLNDDNPELCVDNDLSLKTQGIFCSKPRIGWDNVAIGQSQLNRKGICHIWGFTRLTMWVNITVYIHMEEYEQCLYAKADKVVIHKADIDEVLNVNNVTMKDIWKTMGNAVKAWEVRHYNQYCKAKELYQVVFVEELALAALKEKQEIE